MKYLHLTIYHLIMLLGLVMVITGCGKKEDEPDSIALSFTTKNAAAAGETFTVSVTSNRTWLASSDKAWVTATPISGNGNTNIEVKVAENQTTTDDQATIQFIAGTASQNLIISRGASTPTLSISPIEDQNIPATGKTIQISISSNGDWAVVSDQAWAKPSIQSGKGNGTLSLTIDANTSIAPDDAIIKFTSGAITQNLKIHREGATAQFAISPNDTQNISSSGGNINITITSNSDWTVTSDKTWAKPNIQSGKGNGTLSLTVDANTSTTPDDATLKFTSGTITQNLKIHREGVAVQLSISPDETQNISSSGGKVSVIITSNSDWTVNSNQTWAKPNIASGSGNGTCSIIIDPNKIAQSDVATITFKAGTISKTLVINIAAAPTTLTITPNTTQELTAAGGEVTIAITSNSDWTVTSNKSWATINQSQGKGNSSIIVNVTKNTLSSPQSATLTFTAGSITKTININIAAAQIIEINPKAEQTVPADGTKFNVSITCPDKWEVSSNKAWAIPFPTSGTGNATCSIEILSNSSTVEDIAVLTFKTSDDTKTLTINRLGQTYAVGAPFPNATNPIGIVYEISDGGKHGKIISLDSYQSTWSTEYYTTGATDKDLGMKNMEKIKALNGWELRYPLFKWCADKGKGWYLPAVNEVVKVDKQVFVINNAINSLKIGVKIDTYDFLWSSTEDSMNQAFYMSRGTFSYDNKVYQRDKKDKSYENLFHSRAIMAF